jgi:hypothetical protein
MDFYTCVIYFSLPSFPDYCRLVQNHTVIPRDVLLSSRINDHHISGGMQYDPHIETGEYSICEPPVRRGFKKRAEKCDKMYLLFRTRYFPGDGSSRYLVTGFYEIDKKFGGRESLEAPVLYAKSMHFVSVEDSIDITKKMVLERAFRCQLSCNSFIWGDDVINWVDLLTSRENITDQYVKEINHLKSVFKENEFDGKNYSDCLSCRYNQASNPCPLIWRRNHRKIPQQPANYMKDLAEFYASIEPINRAPLT